MQALHVEQDVTMPMDIMPKSRHHLIAIIVCLQFMVGASFVNSYEQGVSKALKTYTADPMKKDEPLDKRILQNNASMLWVAGGAVLGAYVCTVCRRNFNLTEGPNTFGVAMATAIPLAAFTLHQYFDNRAEYCLLGGFLFALASWALLEIFLALAARWKKTASSHGLSGLKDEMLGRNSSQEESKEQPKS